VVGLGTLLKSLGFGDSLLGLRWKLWGV